MANAIATEKKNRRKSAKAKFSARDELRRALILMLRKVRPVLQVAAKAVYLGETNNPLDAYEEHPVRINHCRITSRFWRFQLPCPCRGRAKSRLSKRALYLERDAILRLNALIVQGTSSGRAGIRVPLDEKALPSAALLLRLSQYPTGVL
jgi:hypothetical protein